MKNVVLPELGEGINSATIACWHYNCGDQIDVDDDLVEVVTDKATFNISAEVKGKLKEIHADEGTEITIGSTLAVIEPIE